MTYIQTEGAMTNEAKHTPGPWIADGSHVCHRDTPNNLHVIAECCVTIDGTDRFANARLIAAAPELYDASIAARKYLCDENRSADDLLPVLDELAAAIAKATGRDA